MDTPSFGLVDHLSAVDGDWHAHRRHQLLYASAGRMDLETASARWLLPPQRAAWICAGQEHRVVVPSRCQLRTVYIDAGWLDLRFEARVFAVTPLAREMLVRGAAWGPDHQDPVAEPFFRALAGLARRWAEEGQDLRLPRARSPELARAMRWMGANLEDADMARAARAAGLSPRTLARRFGSECQTTFRQHLHALRMLEAMAGLEQGLPVSEVAWSVGLRSLSSFTRMFTRWAGETPSAYRARAGDGAAG